MARLYACCSPYWNPPAASEDELAGAAFIKGSGTSTPTFVVSHVPTTVPATTPAITPYSDNELFNYFIKAYWEAQVSAQAAPKVDSEPWKQLFKVRFPDPYYGNLHMDCYRFC